MGRSSFLAWVPACLAGCLAGCFINGNGQAQGEARDNGNDNGSGNGSDNTFRNGTGVASDAAGPSDGTWDITAAGGGAVGPSEMIVVAGRASGFIARKGEGATDPSWSWCTRTLDRTEFEIAAEADVLSATFRVIREWRGYGCPSSDKRTVTVTGVRTTPGKNDVDGEWTVSFIEDASSEQGKLRIGASAGLISCTASRADLSFAARRR